MLRPHDRSLLLDGLRPEPGYVLDQAVGTTFSLDVDALLLAPLSFALFDVDAGKAGGDPVAVLAGVRAYADRMAIYCDAAHIAAPPKERPLFQMLERTIHPVSQPGGVFHPKLWVLRFRSTEGKAPTHRALVLSRNLTFDRSWDTVLRLDEADSDSPLASNGAELATFLRVLNERSPSTVVTQLLTTLADVAFDAPNGFESARFWPMLGNGVDPLADAHNSARELLTISPFATARRLRRLAPNARRRALVTRADTLDRLGSNALDGSGGAPPWQEVYVLRGEANDPGPDPEVAATTDELVQPSEADSAPLGQLSGLHAKLYVLDDGTERRVFTGSANATAAAQERNIELVVELRSTAKETSIQSLLGDDTKDTNLGRLLVPRRPAASDPIAQTPEELEEERLEDIARRLSETPLTARAHKDTDGSWRVTIELSLATAALESGDVLRARLVSTNLPWEPLVRTGRQAVAELVAGNASRVTSLIAFTLAGGRDLDVAPRRFVLVAELTEAPDDREDQLLLDLVPDATRMMRLLFMLLADGQQGVDGAFEVRRILAGGSANSASGWELSLPLFENLVRSFAREPERLRTIQGLISRLRDTEEGRKRFPEGFLEMWKTFDAALPAEHRTKKGSR